jgi:hypothetical protein
LTRCSKRAHARIAKGGGLIALHHLAPGDGRAKDRSLESTGK